MKSLNKTLQDARRRAASGCLAMALAASFPAVALDGATIEGIVPLPDAPPASVMAKRYEIVSSGGALSTQPPVAIVWLEGAFEPASEPEPTEMGQRDFVFEPALLPVRVGTRVYFPNYDQEYHNVFSYSRPKRFDLGRYLPHEPPPSQVFDQPGVVVLRCDIHEHMRAIILVLDSPHFAATDFEGHFRLEGLPAGDFELKAWVDSKTTLSLPVRLEADQKITIDF